MPKSKFFSPPASPRSGGRDDDGSSASPLSICTDFYSIPIPKTLLECTGIGQRVLPRLRELAARVSQDSRNPGTALQPSPFYVYLYRRGLMIPVLMMSFSSTILGKNRDPNSTSTASTSGSCSKNEHTELRETTSSRLRDPVL